MLDRSSPDLCRPDCLGLCPSASHSNDAEPEVLTMVSPESWLGL